MRKSGRSNSLDGDIVKSCQQLFSEEGSLFKFLPTFEPRASQIELATAIAKAIVEKSHLVAEAGTGTGKTFAYLIPCLLSGKKSLISTATKTLQDQLYQKDLPLLLKVLGLASRVQNLKGRSNYICRYRLALYVREGRFSSPQISHELVHIWERLSLLTEGERGELPEIAEDSLVWPYATSTKENCLGSECEQHALCFLIKARKRAQEADLVIINHALFFADARLKEEGFGEILPNRDTVIFDEAHQLAEIAANFYGERIGTRQIRELIDDLIRESPAFSEANQHLNALSLELDQIYKLLFLASANKEERFAWEKVVNHRNFNQSWLQLIELINRLVDFLKEIDNENVLKPYLKRTEELKQKLVIFTEKNSNSIRWLECFKHNLVFHATPIDIALAFKACLSNTSRTFVFTSATLTMANSFACFTKSLGLVDAKTLSLLSPFNFQKQALLYLPRDLPDPKHPNYYECLLEKALPIINACKGRCFFLFTSHKALKIVAQSLANILNYPLLIQGEEAKTILLARFRQLGNAVLLGTATFWEGVDVKGEALSCVIIDKLPFVNPSDPLMQGRIASYRSQGLSGFNELTLPHAVLALKQGVGRLIRDTQDKGLLMIADPRLTSREYGRLIFASLPSMPKTRDEQTALTFINEVVLKNESISH